MATKPQPASDDRNRRRRGAAPAAAAEPEAPPPQPDERIFTGQPTGRRLRAQPQKRRRSRRPKRRHNPPSRRGQRICAPPDPARPPPAARRRSGRAADYQPPPAPAPGDALPDDIADALAESADDDHGDDLPAATVAGADYLAEAAPARRWPWLVSVLLLAAALLFQVGYAYRTELAKHYPDLRPAMEAACERLGCSVELPREADRISIESSDLNPESDKSRLQLAATLKNRAPYAQSYPHLELTLTDVRDQPLVRRVFTPAEYLAKDAPASFAPEAEASVRLMLEVADSNASGYRLYLFYP
ncbi:MAG: DUF3426 domain-containing protein [Sterolibacteriaceae bacterium]|nr:DUF3426 domain-containing protein [Candidatus Methylophosphatis haderslevensis]